MATIDLHQKPFDDATITKLEIFENYAKEWLPTFIMSYPNKDLWIFDFFAGTGYDMVGVPGSPIRILRQIKNQTGNIFKQKTRIRVCFNEFDKSKFEQLKSSTENFITTDNELERLCNNNLLLIEYRDSDFAELFPKLDLFEGHLPTKIDTFQNNLKDLILYREITTNKEAYDYTLEQGHLDKHANDIIKKMKNEGLIKYDAKSPMVNYEQVCKNKKIIEYYLMP